MQSSPVCSHQSHVHIPQMSHTIRRGSLTCPHAGLHESGILLQHDVKVVPQVRGQEVWTGVKELEVERGMPLACGQRCCPQPRSQT